MKTIDYYMNLPYRLEIVPDTEEGGYVASFPDLPGCLTCGSSVEIVIKNAEDAKREWLTVAIEEGLSIKEPEKTSDQQVYSGQFKLRLPKSLHKTLAEQARAEGISLNQYCIYLLSKNSI